MARKHSHKIVTGALVTPKGLRVPFARKKNISELQTQIATNPPPDVQAKLYQRLCGALSSAGQIEQRFAVGALSKNGERNMMFGKPISA